MRLDFFYFLVQHKSCRVGWDYRRKHFLLLDNVVDEKSLFKTLLLRPYFSGCTFLRLFTTTTACAPNTSQIHFTRKLKIVSQINFEVAYSSPHGFCLRNDFQHSSLHLVRLVPFRLDNFLGQCHWRDRLTGI